MNDKKTIRFSEKKNLLLRAAALLMAILAAGALFACWTMRRTDRAMRADLLQQTRMAAQSLNVDRVKALSGTAADLNNSHYMWLKEKLSAARLANPQCRFLYLMGRKFNGAIFFFLDSERVDSKNYSPPGQVDNKAPEVYRSVFDTKAEVVVGPATDRWGTWVSGLVPIYDPQTGAILAVLGMDIDARAWNWDVAARAALPMGLMLVLLIGMFAVWIYRLLSR